MIAMTKRIKICGYVDIPDHMTAEEFFAAVNGVDMFINDHDPDVFKLHLDGEETAITDNVNHPAHYGNGKLECIDVMLETQGVEAVKGFCLCNAFKYLYRHNNKNGVEDIRKARWYLDKYLELEGEKDA